jgi:hypothetical protein
MATLQKAFAELQRIGLVRRVITPETMHSVGLPRYEESVYARGHYLLIPDIDTYLVVDPITDSTDRRPKANPSHSHGYLPQHPRMYPSLVLGGAGVKRGVTIGHARNIDIAPTIAQLLGFEMTGVAGSAIGEALE